MSVVNRALLVHFVESVKTNEFPNHFNIYSHQLKHFLKWNTSSNIFPETRIANMLKWEARAWLKPLNFTIFASISNTKVQMNGTKQVCQVLRSSLVLATCAKKILASMSLFIPFFEPNKVPSLQ